jgi:hypothetical protein
MRNFQKMGSSFPGIGNNWGSEFVLETCGLSPKGSPVRFPYLTSKAKLSEWLLNSGAYMHWISAMPVW